jgi:tight adherence protein B
MTPTPLLGAMVGALIATGLFLIALGFLAPAPNPAPATPTAPKRVQLPAIDVRAFLGFAGVGVVVAAVTGWWAIGVLATLAGVVVPAIRNERAQQMADRKRVAAVASWVESVRDLLSAASGIEEAITRSAETLPHGSPIAGEVDRLRIVTTMGGLREGLRRFGQELSDPTVDYVTATLQIASERSSGVLHDQLSEAAVIAREQVSLRERVEASRSRMRTTSTTIVAVTVVMVVFIIGTQPSYGTWYAQSTGQIVLTIAGAIEIVGMWWMARLARPLVGTRIVLDSSTNITGIGGFPT